MTVELFQLIANALISNLIFEFLERSHQTQPAKRSPLIVAGYAVFSSSLNVDRRQVQRDVSSELKKILGQLMADHRARLWFFHWRMNQTPQNGLQAVEYEMR